MIFTVTHQLNYRYSAAVFPEPHILRLWPRCDACQQIGNFSMVVDPQPAGLHHFLDAEGNNATSLWFETQTPSLTICTSFEAQLLCPNPFGYLVTDPSFLQLPSAYPAEEEEALTPYLAALASPMEMDPFCGPILKAAKGNTLDFLSRLCTTLYENFTFEIRDQGPPLSPAVTLHHRRGACRDLAKLFMAACRNVGLAARFVSGYQEGDPDTKHRHLHAWAEVYLPGAGWRGYDPTHGLAVTDRHIALAASHHSTGAAPVTGNFRGTGITAEMDFLISLTRSQE